jgi:cell division protein FtsB
MTVTRLAWYRVGVLARLPWAFVRSGWRQAVATALCVVGAALLVSIAYGDRASGLAAESDRLRADVERLEKVNAGIRSRNATLTRQLKSLRSNQALLEHNAREDLGFIRDGEVVVVLPK